MIHEHNAAEYVKPMEPLYKNPKMPRTREQLNALLDAAYQDGKNIGESSAYHAARRSAALQWEEETKQLAAKHFTQRTEMLGAIARLLEANSKATYSAMRALVDDKPIPYVSMSSSRSQP